MGNYCDSCAWLMSENPEALTSSLKNLRIQLQKFFKQICAWWQHWVWPFLPNSFQTPPGQSLCQRSIGLAGTFSELLCCSQRLFLTNASSFLLFFFTSVKPAVVRQSSRHVPFSLPFYLSEALLLTHFLNFSVLASASCRTQLPEGHDLRHFVWLLKSS